MSDFCLSCCSTVDLSPEWMKKRDLRYVCFRYTLDGAEYLDDMGLSMPSEELFRRMSNGAETKTSQVSVEEYIAHRPILLCPGRPGLQREMLYLPFPVRGGRPRRGRPGGGAVPQAPGKGGDFPHRDHHRQPHRPGHRGAVLLGLTPDGLTGAQP